MKKVKSSRQVTLRKSPGVAKDVDSYLAALPKSCEIVLSKMRAAIREATPKEAIETISYGIPAIKDKKILVWFAGFSDHCSLFPTAAVIEEFQEDLKNFPTSKGTVRFSLSEPLPISLIKKMVKFRVAQSRIPKPSKTR